MKKKHKGHEYEVKFCDPVKDWGDKKGMFHIELAMGSNEYFNTYAEAEEEAKKLIDDFVESVPQKKEEWLEALNGCMVWTGYESCHLDEDMCLAVLEKAQKYYKREA